MTAAQMLVAAAMAASLAAAAQLATAQPPPTVSPPNATESAAKGFIWRRGVQLMQGDAPFYFIGGNAYWLNDIYTMNYGRRNIDDFFETCRRLGLKSIRTWAFNTGMPLRLLTYDARQFAGLDYVVWSAKRHGIRLVFALGNSWNAYKGPEEFLAQATGSAVGKDLLNFYQDPATRALYKLHMWTIVSRMNNLTGLRYNEDPTIMAWNILNEPRCPGCNSQQQLIHQDWLTDMAKFLRRAAPWQLITAATEGFFVEVPGDPAMRHLYNPGSGAQCDGEDWLNISRIPEVDYSTVHVYDRHMEWQPQPNPGNPGWPNWVYCQFSCYMPWFDNYIKVHEELSINMTLKPMVIEEFGLTWHKKTPEERKILFQWVFDHVKASQRSSGPLAGAMFWNAANGITPDADGYNVRVTQPERFRTESEIPWPAQLPAGMMSPEMAEATTFNITYYALQPTLVASSAGAPAQLAAEMWPSGVPASTIAAATAESTQQLPVGTGLQPLLADGGSVAVAPRAPGVVGSVSVGLAAAGSPDQAAPAPAGRAASSVPSNATSARQPAPAAATVAQPAPAAAGVAVAQMAGTATVPYAAVPLVLASGRRLAQNIDHLDAFRRGGWRQACAAEAAKTWRPYQLFNLTDGITQGERAKAARGRNIVSIISEATAAVK